ncbi:YwqH-like family protein [Staphylococcus epidermidis]|uniref:YwqH-like family protein n=1 Tax=Staphylococcus epidermidis TaxID=1282 RepID=UPI001E6333D4|nr:DUF5082 domain-containing protein [Staphylococcus epidermidis]
MSNKAELRRRRAQYQSQKRAKESELSDLKADRKRLKEAIKSAEEIIEDFDSEHKTYKSIEIENNEWKGETRDKSDDKKDELDEAIFDYGKKYDDVVDQMNKDLDELNKKIGGVETDISELGSRIESINRQLDSD